MIRARDSSHMTVELPPVAAVVVIAPATVAVEKVNITLGEEQWSTVETNQQCNPATILTR